MGQKKAIAARGQVTPLLDVFARYYGGSTLVRWYEQKEADHWAFRHDAQNESAWNANWAHIAHAVKCTKH